MSKSQAWSQPSHPAPAADLNLNPDPKFQGAVTAGFSSGSSQTETFNQNFASQCWGSWGVRCHPLCPRSPIPSPQRLQVRSCVRGSLWPRLVLQSSARQDFSRSAAHPGSLSSWLLGFTMPWPLTEAFREQRAGFRARHYNLAFKNYYYYYFQGNQDSRSYLLCDFSHPEVFT